MYRILAASAAVIALNAAAFAFTPHDDLVANCIDEGNDEADCSCAADFIVDTLNDNELTFMMTVMDADTNEPTDVMAIAAEQGMELTDIIEMGQKMQAVEPAMREQCDIDGFN